MTSLLLGYYLVPIEFECFHHLSCIAIFHLDFLKFHPLVSHTTVNFTKPVQHYQVGETARLVVGQTLVLHCNVSGSPSPAYQWSVPRKGLTVTKADNVVRDGNTLTITNVQAQNDNEYQCTASNQFGKITNSSLVTVYGKICIE